MRRLMNVARDRGLDIMGGEILAGHIKLLRLCKRLGCRTVRNPADPEVATVRRHL